MKKFAQVPVADRGGMAARGDGGKSVGTRIKRDHPVLFGKPCQLAGKDLGRHHPAGYKHQGFRSGTRFEVVQTNAVRGFEIAVLGSAGQGGLRKEPAEESDQKKNGKTQPVFFPFETSQKGKWHQESE